MTAKLSYVFALTALLLAGPSLASRRGQFALTRPSTSSLSGASHMVGGGAVWDVHSLGTRQLERHRDQLVARQHQSEVSEPRSHSRRRVRQPLQRVQSDSFRRDPMGGHRESRRRQVHGVDGKTLRRLSTLAFSKQRLQHRRHAVQTGCVRGVGGGRASAGSAVGLVLLAYGLARTRTFAPNATRSSSN